MNGALGRVPSRKDPRTLRLANYGTNGMLPASPPARSWGTGLTFPLYANDRIGDCAIASAAHLGIAWLAAKRATDAMIDRAPLDEAAVVSAYRAVSGYNPMDPSTDVGCQMIDVLRYWRKHGIGDDKITAFAAVDPDRRDHIAACVNLFGGCYIGADLPTASQDDPVWRAPSIEDRGRPEWRAGSWGGHAMAIVGYDRASVQLVTWGRVQRATWSWIDAYVSEAWAVVDPVWSFGERTPAGFDVGRLAFDLSRL